MSPECHRSPRPSRLAPLRAMQNSTKTGARAPRHSLTWVRRSRWPKASFRSILGSIWRICHAVGNVRSLRIPAGCWDSNSRPDATPGPPLRPCWARASADQGGGEVGGPPGLRRLGCFPRPIIGLPAGVPTKPRVTADRNERRIAKGAKLENEHRSVTARGWASPICNARERAGRGQFRLSRS